MITKEQYLTNPCKESSLPYWKLKNIVVPEEIQIIHDDFFNPAENLQYTEERYFRLFHPLKNLAVVQMPNGFCLCSITLTEYVNHINSCYDNIGVSEAELSCYLTRPVYDTALWLAVKDTHNGSIAATGIAEWDREIGEGILEWIQVSEKYRRQGLGRFLVCELLRRMKDKADFATVSGRCNQPTNPEQLYRNCGFTGTDVWHIVRKK